jgi:hypothetical protein
MDAPTVVAGAARIVQWPQDYIREANQGRGTRFLASFADLTARFEVMRAGALRGLNLRPVRKV